MRGLLLLLIVVVNICAAFRLSGNPDGARSRSIARGRNDVLRMEVFEGNPVGKNDQ
jgi:hypothetical protein